MARQVGELSQTPPPIARQVDELSQTPPPVARQVGELSQTPPPMTRQGGNLGKYFCLIKEAGSRTRHYRQAEFASFKEIAMISCQNIKVTHRTSKVRHTYSIRFFKNY